MIFLTVGTHEPFDRLVRVVDDWAGATPSATVFGQVAVHDDENYRPRNFEWVQKMAPAEYREAFERAELIVSHAGMGSIITALAMQKPIVVLPRRGYLRETRNDHQWATAQRLTERAGLAVVMNDDEVADALSAMTGEGIQTSAAIPPYASDELVAGLRAFIFEGPTSR